MDAIDPDEVRLILLDLLLAGDSQCSLALEGEERGGLGGPTCCRNISASGGDSLGGRGLGERRALGAETREPRKKDRLIPRRVSGNNNAQTVLVILN